MALKAPEAAKSRLSSVLTCHQRRVLFFSLAEHVLDVLNAAPSIHSVTVVTSNDEVAVFATLRGCAVLREQAALGTARAFAWAVDHLWSLECQSVLMVGGDLPLLTVDAVERLVGLQRGSPCVVLAPDRLGLGTNALLCSPPTVIAPCFGVQSFRRHVEVAHHAGVPCHVVRSPELAFDVDTPSDLQEWIALNPNAVLARVRPPRVSSESIEA